MVAQVDRGGAASEGVAAAALEAAFSAADARLLQDDALGDAGAAAAVALVRDGRALLPQRTSATRGASWWNRTGRRS